LLAGLIVPAAARADSSTLYVDQHNASCSNRGAGTATQPFCAIWAAVAKAGVGTTVVVSSGVYHEQVTPRSNSETFTAAPGAHVVVTGSTSGGSGNHGFYLYGVNGITIKGFTIITSATGIYAVVSGPLGIHNNSITAGDKGVFVTNTPGTSFSSGVDIRKNRVTGCAHQGIELAQGSTVANNIADQVANNIVDHNSTGIDIQGSWAIISGNALAFNAYRGISLSGPTMTRYRRTSSTAASSRSTRSIRSTT
jgi:hypothetical protein